MAPPRPPAEAGVSIHVSLTYSTNYFLCAPHPRTLEFWNRASRGSIRSQEKLHKIFSRETATPLKKKFLNKEFCFFNHKTQYRWSSTYDSSALQWCQSDTHSVETILQILKFDLFPCICDNMILSHDAGQQQRDGFAQL